jgi:hypothetical protein
MLFQGSHSVTGYYMFYSTLSKPDVNGSSETPAPYYEAQVDISWIVRGSEDALPKTNAGRLARLKSMATAGTGFQRTLQRIICDIPEHTEVSSIALADWPTVQWHGFDGRVTLLGDAAHPMAMCTYLKQAVKTT